MISNSQIRAARALLNWNRQQLAEASGLATQTLFNIENDESIRPQPATLQAIVNAFLSKGVEFTDRGVRWIDNSIVTLTGPDAYRLMLERVYKVTQKAPTEVLWFGFEGGTMHPEEVEIEKRIRANGTRFRIVSEVGSNKQVVWPREEYRQMPAKYFSDSLQLIYGNEVAQLIEGGLQILVVTNGSFAQTERNKFNMIWPHMAPLPKLKVRKHA